jgi:CelD/BcsL family acetyltransferase involved in cellulose biosynthesis
VDEKPPNRADRNLDDSTRLNLVDPLQDLRWSKLILGHPRASVFHTPAWLEALRRTYGYMPTAYTTTEPGAALQNGVVFSQVESWVTGRRLVSLPFSDHCDPLMDSSSALTPFLSALQQRTLKDRWRYIEIRPLHSVDGAASLFQSTENHLFHQLDLSPGLNTLFHNFHKDSTQRKIHRAEREGLKYREGSNNDLLKPFYRLFLATRRRHQVPPQPLQWFRNLIDAFGDALRIRVAYKGNEPAASILTLQFKDTLTYKYGCSDVRFNNLGGTQMLFWRAIQDAKRLGLRRFDLGRSDMDNSGLAVFKDRLGAARSELTYLRCSPSGSPRGHFVPAENDWKLRIAKQVFSRAPAKALSLIGNILYKHVG